MARQVAVEFALARAFEEPVVEADGAPAAKPRPRAATGSASWRTPYSARRAPSSRSIPRSALRA